MVVVVVRLVVGVGRRGVSAELEPDVVVVVVVAMEVVMLVAVEVVREVVDTPVSG